MMLLRYLPANARWVFTFGGALLRMDGEDLLFETREAAVDAAARHRLRIGRMNVVEADD
jgi:hypothetical protein